MKQMWVFYWLSASLLAFLAISILWHPIATNDGPVHVAFAHVILSHLWPSQSLQSQAYTVHLRPNPNLGVYILMAALMRFLSPERTESLTQLLCILGTFASGCFAIYVINRRNVWLALFLIPLTLNQMFFLGLYNHCISIAAFLLVMGTYFWLNKAPSYLRTVALAGALILTFLCHASGFLIAFTSLTAMIATRAVLQFSRERQPGSVLRSQRFALLALLLPLPLGAVFLTSGDKNRIEYGFTLPYRMKQFAELHLLSTNFPTVDLLPAALMSAVLLSSFVMISVRILSRRASMSEERRDQAIGAIAATIVATIIMLGFPDIMGGGWTHFRRFEIFPFFWMVMVIAFEDLPPLIFIGFTAVGATVSVWLMTSMSIRQHMVREQMAPFAAVDSLIGAHCSVLPVLLQSFLVDSRGNPDLMDYEPFYQVASRLELHNDRVVLFNYLARLPPYPVHFRSGVEPQANLFHWEPDHMPNDVETIDVPGFEASSGMRVDYILLRGNLDRRPPEMRVQVQNATRQFVSIYKSADHGVELYQRQGTHNPACLIHQ